MWFSVTAVIFLYTAVLIVRNLITFFRTERRIAELEVQHDYYLERIRQDSTMIERLNYDEYLEQYARERYHMQRPNEYIYIVEE